MNSNNQSSLNYQSNKNNNNNDLLRYSSNVGLILEQQENHNNIFRVNQVLATTVQDIHNNNNNTDNQQQQQEEVLSEQATSIQSIETEINEFINSCLGTYIKYLMQTSAFYLSLECDINLVIPLLISIGFTLLDCVLAIYSIIKATNDNIIQFKYKFLLLENIFFIVFKGIFCLYLTRIYNFELSYLLIPYMLFTGIRFFVYSLEKQRGITSALNDFIALIIRIFCSVQLTILVIKFDQQIMWEWREVFWTYWVFLAILVGMSFGTFLMLLSKLIHFGQSSAYLYELQGILWILQIELGLTSGSYYFVQGIIKTFQEQSIIVLQSSFLYISCVLFIIIIYMLVFRKSLKVFLNIIINGNNPEQDFSINNSNNIQDEQQSNTNNNNNLQQMQFSENHNFSVKSQKKILSVPHLVYRYSSTYFKTVSEDVKKHLKKDSNQKKENKQKIQSKLTQQKEIHSKVFKRSFSDYYTNQIQMKFTNSIPHTQLMQQPINFNILSTNKGLRDTTIFTNQQNTEMMTTESPLQHQGNKVKEQQQQQSNIKLVPSTGTPSIITSSSSTNAPQSTQNINSIINRIPETKPSKKMREIQNERNKKCNLLRNKTKSGYIQSKIYNQNDMYLLPPIPENISRRSKSHVVLPQVRDFDNNNSNSIDSSTRNSHRKSSYEAIEKSVNQCLICYENQPDAVLMDCGHGGLCYKCSIEIWEQNGDCYLCRDKISQVLQIDIKNPKEKAYKVKAATQMINDDDDQNDDNDQNDSDQSEHTIQNNNNNNNNQEHFYEIQENLYEEENDSQHEHQLEN